MGIDGMGHIGIDGMGHIGSGDVHMCSGVQWRAVMCSGVQWHAPRGTSWRGLGCGGGRYAACMRRSRLEASSRQRSAGQGQGRKICRGRAWTGQSEGGGCPMHTKHWGRPPYAHHWGRPPYAHHWDRPPPPLRTSMASSSMCCAAWGEARVRGHCHWVRTLRSIATGLGTAVSGHG